MKTFSINTLGCKVNQYESQQIRHLLEQLGLIYTEMSQRVNLVVVNTCCVTHTASAKSRQYIRKAQKLSPNATIVVCGCMPSIQSIELNGLNKKVYVISRRDELAGTLSQIANGKIKPENNAKTQRLNNLELPYLTSFKGHTRAFLKIQDGCDGYCSYCIVPKTRPFVHCKPVEIVLQEAHALVAAGHKEIVVTGVFLGAYGQDTVRRKNWPNEQNHKLPDLLDKMAQIPGLVRIRLSSLEPGDVTPRLLDTFCSHRNIMPHLHLSLQSGSNTILKKMCRQYNADDFREKVELIKSRLDRPAITTDIIVGFPTESEADFEQTVALAKEVSFAKIHVFAFSPRQGTAAAMIQDSVDKKVIKERSKILRDLDKKLQSDFRQHFIGETAEVLLEDNDGHPAHRWAGRAERYFYVYLDKSADILKANDLIKMKLVKNSEDGVMGELVH